MFAGPADNNPKDGYIYNCTGGLTPPPPPPPSAPALGSSGSRKLLTPRWPLPMTQASENDNNR